MSRTSEVRVIAGAHPLSDRLRRDADQVERLFRKAGVYMGKDEVTLKRVNDATGEVVYGRGATLTEAYAKLVGGARG